MAATNISASGGLDLLELSKFIDSLVQRKKGNKWADQGSAAPPRAWNNPFYQAGQQSRAGVENVGANTRSTGVATDQAIGDFSKLGGMTPAARAALTQVEGLPLQERGVAADEKRNKIFNRSVKAEATDRQARTETDQFNAIVQAARDMGLMGDKAANLYGRAPGAAGKTFQGYTADATAQQEAYRKALADDEKKKSASAGGGTFWKDLLRMFDSGGAAGKPPAAGSYSQTPGAFPIPYGMGVKPATSAKKPERKLSTTGQIQQKYNEVEAQIQALTGKPGNDAKIAELVQQRDQLVKFLQTLGVMTGK